MAKDVIQAEYFQESRRHVYQTIRIPAFLFSFKCNGHLALVFLVNKASQKLVLITVQLVNLHLSHYPKHVGRSCEKGICDAMRHSACRA